MGIFFHELPEVSLSLVMIVVILPSIQAGANVNITAGGATPLHIAADIGNPEIINCLLDAEADPNIMDEVENFKRL